MNNAEEPELTSIKHRTLRAWLWGRQLFILQILFLPEEAELSRSVTVTVGSGEPSKPIIVRKLSRNPLKKLLDVFRSIRIYKVPLPTDKQINNHVKFSFVLNDVDHSQPVFFYNSKAENNRRLYYVPFSCRRSKGQARHLRRTNSSTLVFVQRPLYQVESYLRFKILESNPVGAGLYVLGKLVDRFSQRRKYVFYEKFSAKAEEGTFELFSLMKRDNPDSYFVISSQSEGFEELSTMPGVVEQFSLRYYWLIYTADTFVGTEAPTHLSILRSNNSWLRRRIYIRPYVFLQHGIIFMKNLGRSSIYVKGREGEPEIMVASSQKEKAVIVRDLLLPEERIMVTGLGQFSLIQPGTVTEKTPDVVTIMLTWRPYDEHIQDSSETAYVKVLSESVAALKSALPTVEVRILAHPKFQEALQLSEFGNDCWQGTVPEALVDTKLLITDYSSIGYNAFYRGSAVVYYQPDLTEYEAATGELIPNNDEYIGHRVFSRSELEAVLGAGQTENGKLDLSYFRTPIHQENYRSINEFDDGKNIERIAENLLSRFHATTTVESL